MSTLPHQRNTLGAFTVVELLVAMSVLTMIMVLVTQLVNGVSLTTSGKHKRIDTDTAARVVMDRIALDLRRMIIRSDIDYGFRKQSGNDELSFFANVPGVRGPDSRQLSLVSYRIDSNYRLQRAAVETTWTDGIFGKSGTNLRIDRTYEDLKDMLSAPPGDEDLFFSFGPDVFRFEVGFLVHDDANELKVETNPLEIEKLSIREIKGVSVAIAVLDAHSREIYFAAKNVGDEGEDEGGGEEGASPMKGLADYFDDTLPAGGSGGGETSFKDYLEAWQSSVNTVIDDSNVPQQVRENLRVYQRYYLF